MRIIVQATHPAHVHFFRHSIKELKNRGHEIRVFATPKDITTDLLENYGIDYEMPHKRPKFHFYINSQLKLDYKLYKMAKNFDADVITSVGGTSAAHVSAVTDARSVVFYDTEHATLQNAITYPFADVIFTPDCYQGDIGSHQIRYPGYQELAYLHPDRFEPDPTILDDIDVDEGERLVIMRLVAWGAAHDFGDGGFNDIRGAVGRLEDVGARVLITSEAPLPDELERCRISIPPERIHHLMYYSDLFIGESATMATESAVLGTPALFVSSSRRGYTDELEQRYGLVFNFSDKNKQMKALEKAESILRNYDQKTWEQRRETMLDDKIDTTDVIIAAVEDEYEPEGQVTGWPGTNAQ